ncbi:MAG: DUF6770 family protein [bacterium]
MKNKLLLVLFGLCFCIGQSQEKTLNDITEFKIKNSGAFMDNNNDVDGYYFFYEVDKLKKGMREYAIKMLDKNLNDIATKSYIDNKNTILAQSNFNNQQLMFAMINLKERQYKLVPFDRQGNQGDEVVISVSKKEVRWLSQMMKSGNFNLLFPIDNKGFLFNYIRDNKKLGYGLKYIATDGGASWDYNSPDDIKEIQMINPIQATEDYIMAIQTSKPSLLSKKVDMKLVVLDINDGSVLFSRSFNREDDPRLVTNVFVNEEKQIVVLGEYYNPGDNVINDESQGLFLKVVDSEGNDVVENKVNWQKIDQYIPKEEGKKAKRGYVYFHDIIRTQKGTYLGIGEKYRKTVSLKGMLLNGQVGSGMTQLTITDALFVEFDKDFTLQDIKVVKKGKSRVQNLADFGSPQLNAHVIKAIGGFDYQYTQIDKKRDRLYAMFVDYERLKGEKNKSAFKSIIYDNNELSEDKIYLKNSKGSITFRALPAKLGNVMLMEYDRKKKTLEIHLEQLNVN